MSTEPIVVLSSVSKDYVSGAGIVRAMRDVDLTIENAHRQVPP